MVLALVQAVLALVVAFGLDLALAQIGAILPVIIATSRATRPLFTGRTGRAHRLDDGDPPR
jgi:hypothetical protein